MSEGLVLSTIGGVYKVFYNNKILDLKPRGIFRHKKIKLLIGDKVIVNEQELVIEEVLERKNSLFRPRIANIDLGVVVMSLSTPTFSSYLVDKFLTLLNMSDIKPLIECFDNNLVNSFEGYKKVTKELKDGKLYLIFEDKDGDKLKAEWQASDNYAVWQTCGICGDDYTGFLLFPTYKEDEYFCLWYKC